MVGVLHAQVWNGVSAGLWLGLLSTNIAGLAVLRVNGVAAHGDPAATLFVDDPLPPDSSIGASLPVGTLCGCVGLLPCDWHGTCRVAVTNDEGCVGVHGWFRLPDATDSWAFWHGDDLGSLVLATWLALYIPLVVFGYKVISDRFRPRPHTVVLWSTPLYVVLTSLDVVAAACRHTRRANACSLACCAPTPSWMPTSMHPAVVLLSATVAKTQCQHQPRTVAPMRRVQWLAMR